MICQVPDCTEHYGCRLKGGNLTVSARRGRGKPGSAPHQYNQWERGIAGEDRGNGFFMPYVGDDGDDMGVYELQGKRRKVESIRRAQINSTTPLGA